MRHCTIGVACEIAMHEVNPKWVKDKDGRGYSIISGRTTKLGAVRGRKAVSEYFLGKTSGNSSHAGVLFNLVGLPDERFSSRFETPNIMRPLNIMELNDTYGMTFREFSEIILMALNGGISLNQLSTIEKAHKYAYIIDSASGNLVPQHKPQEKLSHLEVEEDIPALS